MTQVTPESIKEFFEQAAKAYGDAWKVQADYYDGLVRRNTKALTDLAYDPDQTETVQRLRAEPIRHRDDWSDQDTEWGREFWGGF